MTLNSNILGPAGALLAAASLILAPAPAEAAPEATRPREVEAERTKIEIPKQTRTYVEQASKPMQEKARKMFKRANKLFEQRQVDEAYKLYKKAYAVWPHPRILFNIAVTLGFLSRPLDSARTFREVLEYGQEPISDLRYKQAAERYIELMGQLATLVLTSQDVGAKIFVDGAPAGEAPLEKKITLGPGTHMITATLEGKVPYSAQVRLEPGQLKRVNVALQAFSDVVRYKTVDRYHWWVPTVVSAAAALAASAGAAMIVTGQNEVQELQTYVDGIRDKTATFPFDDARHDKGVQLQEGGYAMIGVAGATAATAVLLWILRKKKVRYTVGAGKGGVKISF